MLATCIREGSRVHLLTSSNELKTSSGRVFWLSCSLIWWNKASDSITENSKVDLGKHGCGTRSETSECRPISLMMIKRSKLWRCCRLKLILEQGRARYVGEKWTLHGKDQREERMKNNERAARLRLGSWAKRCDGKIMRANEIQPRTIWGPVARTTMSLKSSRWIAQEAFQSLKAAVNHSSGYRQRGHYVTSCVHLALLPMWVHI